MPVDELILSFCKVHVGLVDYGRLALIIPILLEVEVKSYPLKWCPMQSLTGRAVTELCVERLLTGNLVLNSSAKARPCVDHMERLIWVAE